VNNKDRTFIAAQLQAGQKPDSVAHALLMRRALEEVEKVARELAYSESRSAWITEQRYVTLFGPKLAPVLVGVENGTELWQSPARQEYKVRMIDLPAFAKEMGLDLKALREVTEGKRSDVKGYICLPTGAPFDVGIQWIDPNPENARRAERKAKEAEEAKHPRKKMSAYPLAAPVIDWTPAQK
jgi:hypothetical protein